MYICIWCYYFEGFTFSKFGYFSFQFGHVTVEHIAVQSDLS